MSKEYEIALSFAGEQRDYVREVFRHLQAAGVRVFYDENERASLWGKDLAEHLQQVYLKMADYVVMFISSDYVAKLWTGHEKRAALAAALSAGREYILPVRFDDTDLAGLNPTVRFEDARTTSPLELADLVARKLGKALPSIAKANSGAPPASPGAVGTAVFAIDDHDGRFLIGQDHYAMETMWTRAGSHSAHVYNDPPSISGVAIAEGASEITDVEDAGACNFTSRTRTPNVGQVIVVRNRTGVYAALKLKRAYPLVEFDYSILVDGSADFSRLASQV